MRTNWDIDPLCRKKARMRGEKSPQADDAFEYGISCGGTPASGSGTRQLRWIDWQHAGRADEWSIEA
jgi:hypothetical protein